MKASSLRDEAFFLNAILISTRGLSLSREEILDMRPLPFNWTSFIVLMMLNTPVWCQNNHPYVLDHVEAAPLKAVTWTKDSPMTSRNSRNQGDTIWTNDFSSPSEWQIDNFSGTSFGWEITNSNTTWFFEDPIQSPSGGSYALLNNGDPTAGTVSYAEHILTTQQPIDISGLNSFLLLSYHQYFARYQDTFAVEISTNNQSWILLDDNTWIDPLTANTGEASNNSDQRLHYIPKNVVDGETDLWLRFRWKSRQSGPNEGVCYGWMLDDITLQEANQRDLSLTKNRFITSNANEWKRFYTHIPSNHSKDISLNYSADIQNVGLESADSAYLQVAVDDPTGRLSFYSNVDTLGPGTIENFSLATSESVFQSGKGIYDITWLAGSEWTDEYRENNSQTFQINISDSVFAMDFDNYSGLGQFYQGYSYQIGNLFAFEEPDTVSSISVLFQSATSVGGAIQCHIYDGTLTNPLVSSSIRSLAPHEIDRWITIDVPDTLLPAGDYIAAFETFGDTVLWAVDAGNPENDDLKTFVEPIKGDGWFFTNSIPFIRLNVKGRTCASIQTSISTVDAPTCGNTDGILEAVATGGQGIVNYNWLNSNDSTVSDSATAHQLAAGVYQLITSDSTGCLSSSFYALSDSGTLGIVIDSNSILSLPCHDECSGIISLDLDHQNQDIVWSSPMWVGTHINNVCAGDYMVSVTDTSECLAAEVITVSQPSTAVVGTAMSSAENIAEATAQGGQPPYSFTWSNGAGESATGQTVVGISGGMDWTVTITDANGCNFEVTTDVISSTASLERTHSNLRIYPNPSKREIHLTWTLFEEAPEELRLLNVAGQVVFHSTQNLSSSTRTTLDVDKLNPGIYMLFARQKNQWNSFKVIIQ